MINFKNARRFAILVITAYVTLITVWAGWDIWVNLWWQPAFFLVVLAQTADPSSGNASRRLRIGFTGLAVSATVGLVVAIYWFLQPGLNFHTGMGWGSYITVGGYSLVLLAELVLSGEL